MLNWWLGKGVEGSRVQDGNQNQEPPETPAPVFAARALRSALFGTPALPDDETLYEIEKEEEDPAEPSKMTGMSRSVSPTKPPGILMTPGTGATRRKTVSFGNEVVDKAEEKKSMGKVTSKSGIPDDCPGKFPSPWTANAEASTKRKRKTSLTKVLEDAREGKAAKVQSQSSAGPSGVKPPLNLKPDSKALLDLKPDLKNKPSRLEPGKSTESHLSNQELLQQMIVHPGLDNDMTVDLNDPHSQSGKFWKSNFEQYHEDAKAEMAKLFKYKQLAKSYAKLKDVQSINLEEKLKEEQRKVVHMEDKIARLSAQIAVVGLEGNEDESPEMIKELARQTALAVQYKGQVEEFRHALEDSNGREGGSHGQNRKKLTSALTDLTLLDTRHELRKAREELKEMVGLREEMSKLRETLSTTEKTVTKLQEENTKLTQELLHADLRLESHLEKCENKRRSFEERRQRREEELQELQKDYSSLKELAKSQRRDAEQLLKGRHDQVVKLKKEIASMKGTETTAQELQRTLRKKIAEHEQVVADLEKRIERLKDNGKERLVDERSAKEETRESPLNLSSTPLAAVEPTARESQIPVVSPGLARPSKAVASSKQALSTTPTGPLRSRSSQPALSEIVNGASADSIPPPRYGPVRHTPAQSQVTPLASRFSNLSLESPMMQLPSPEASLSQLPSRAIHDRNCRRSPRPSMFNIASSPPKAAVVRSQTNGELSRQRSHNDLAARRLANMSSDRLSSLDNSKPRVALPPERAAAARARLEQKNAEKKRAQEAGRDKENVRL